MLLRKLGKFIRGNVSRFQIMLAAILGSILGFLPEFSSAPGLMITLFLVILVFNANLFLFGITYLVVSLIALLVTPLTFQVGIFLLDGPVRGLFQGLVNAPVTAWFGFEYYLTSGGLVLGLLVGLITGIILMRLLRRFQSLLANLEESSPRFQTLSGKWWFRTLMFVFFGGLRGKKSFREIVEEGTRGSLFRPLGIAAVVIFAVLLFIGSLFLDEKILREIVRSELEKANGATVDLESFTLEPGMGRVTIGGLAMADASELETNLFSADSLVADVGIADLLTKQFTVNNLVIDTARSGQKRRVPGRPADSPAFWEKEPKMPDILSKPGETTVEDIVSGFPEWKRRLTKLKSWLENASKSDEETTGKGDLRSRLREQARLLGYSKVKADHLISGKPTFTLENLEIGRIQVADLPDEVFKLTGAYLSTQPNLLESAPVLDLNTDSGRMAFNFNGMGLSATSGANELDFHYNDLPVEVIRDALADTMKFPLREGSIDIRTERASLTGAILDMTLDIHLKNAVLALDGDRTLDLSSLRIPATLNGPVNQPRLTLDPSALQNVLGSALKEKAKGAVEEKLKEELGGDVEKEINKVLPGGMDSLFKKKE